MGPLGLSNRKKWGLMLKSNNMLEMNRIINGVESISHNIKHEQISQQLAHMTRVLHDAAQALNAQAKALQDLVETAKAFGESAQGKTFRAALAQLQQGAVDEREPQN